MSVEDHDTTIIYPRNTTDIARGDRFLFRGLEGQTVERKKWVEVTGISVSGSLNFLIKTDDGNSSMHSIPYTRAIVLIEQRIWLPEARAKFAEVDGG